MNVKIPAYVLLTSARNEEEFIEKTINSVINQTILPKIWIIVNDGSTDSTEKIINKYCSKYDFISLISNNNTEKRNFGAKARAIKLAYQTVTNIEYDYIGNLDADVSFDQDYYKNVINEFEKDDKLGIAGGIRYDLKDNEFVKLNTAPDSVGGPIQFFRKECFEKIGGYIPLRFGGIDAVAETSARMYGWKVKHFPQYKVYHYRLTGFAKSNIFTQRFNMGLKNYSIGYHPLFQFFKIISTDFMKPYIISSLLILIGYIWGAIRRYKIPISKEFKAYLRKEQMNKILNVLKTLRINNFSQK